MQLMINFRAEEGEWLSKKSNVKKRELKKEG